MSNGLTVETTDDEIVLKAPGGESRHVRWSELIEVFIATTDHGPFGEDVFWVLRGDKVALAIPSSTSGVDALQTVLGRRLPGFNFKAVIDAMGSTGNAQFACWSRDQAA